MYLSDQRTRTAFMNGSIAKVLATLTQQPLPDGTLSNLVLAMYFMSKVSSSRDYLLSPPVNLDRVLIPITNHDNPKIKANVGRVYKNLNSDINEAIEEGAVATLIAMSLEVCEYTNIYWLARIFYYSSFVTYPLALQGKIKNQASDEFQIPPVRAYREFRSQQPACRDEILQIQNEANLAPTRWFAKVIVTKGGAAGKGPDAPEPPQMTTDGSSEYPPMLEELDSAEVEGKTKMAFAKMQVPANVRELYLLTDGDFVTGKENDEASTDADKEEERTATETAADMDGALSRDELREGSVADSIDSGARSRGSQRGIGGADGIDDGNSSHSGSLRGDGSLSRKASRRHTTSTTHGRDASSSPSPDKKRGQQRSRGSMRQGPATQAAKMGLYA